jgi:hypothetical protein
MMPHKITRVVTCPRRLKKAKSDARIIREVLKLLQSINPNEIEQPGLRASGQSATMAAYRGGVGGL